MFDQFFSSLDRWGQWPLFRVPWCRSVQRSPHCFRFASTKGVSSKVGHHYYWPAAEEKLFENWITDRENVCVVFRSSFFCKDEDYWLLWKWTVSHHIDAFPGKELYIVRYITNGWQGAIDLLQVDKTVRLGHGKVLTSHYVDLTTWVKLTKCFCLIHSQINDWQGAIDSLQVDRTVPEVDWAKPGTDVALRRLDDFCKSKLRIYDTDRNNVDDSAQTQLSPWIHFGRCTIYS